MAECNASLFISHDAAEKCRPALELQDQQPYEVAEVVIPSLTNHRTSLGYPVPLSHRLSETVFYELRPVSWCHDDAEFGFPLGGNIANAKRCCEMLRDVLQQTAQICRVKVVPRQWLADAARVKLSAAPVD